MLFMIVAQLFKRSKLKKTMKILLVLLTLIWALNKDSNDKYFQKDIFIVTRNGCGFSRAMRSFLDARNADYQEINISEEGKKVITDLNLTGKTFPMVFVKKEYIGGYSDGTLDPKLLNAIKNNQKQDKNIIKAREKLFAN